MNKVTELRPQEEKKQGIDLPVVENGIIPIYQNEKQERLVSGRELHAFLESKQQFGNWIHNRIKKYGFVEGVDYLIILLSKKENGRGGHNRKEYALKTDLAKELSMIEDNEKGRQARKYFIDAEKKLKSISSNPIDISKITVFDMARHLLTAEQDIKAKEAVIQKQETQILQLTVKNENLKDKARTAEQLTGTNGLIGLSALAGSLDIPIYKLKGMLIAHGWLYQRGERLYVHNRQRKHIRLKFDSKNGKITTRPLLTGNGLVYVADRLLKSGLITKKQADEAKQLKLGLPDS